MPRTYHLEDRQQRRLKCSVPLNEASHPNFHEVAPALDAMCRRTRSSSNFREDIGRMRPPLSDDVAGFIAGFARDDR
jgi:hypothetical protein